MSQELQGTTEVAQALDKPEDTVAKTEEVPIPSVPETEVKQVDESLLEPTEDTPTVPEGGEKEEAKADETLTETGPKVTGETVADEQAKPEQAAEKEIEQAETKKEKEEEPQGENKTEEVATEAAVGQPAELKDDTEEKEAKATNDADQPVTAEEDSQSPEEEKKGGKKKVNVIKWLKKNMASHLTKPHGIKKEKHSTDTNEDCETSSEAQGQSEEAPQEGQSTVENPNADASEEKPDSSDKVPTQETAKDDVLPTQEGRQLEGIGMIGNNLNKGLVKPLMGMIHHLLPTSDNKTEPPAETTKPEESSEEAHTTVN
ncbi:unnamed protein product [Calicophoron daubneyi]|uniref:Uncharacterized protein n=1 Tax=Calicophoron daubneyi TaxID=300641 RepID=A0AAV2TPW4_CALDB